MRCYIASRSRHSYSLLVLRGDRLDRSAQRLDAENLEALLARDLRELDVGLVQLLLHDLLQHLERKAVSLLEGHVL